jgi:hypothetical protein
MFFLDLMPRRRIMGRGARSRSCAGPVPCVHTLKLTDQVVLTSALSYLLMLDGLAAEQLVAASSKPVTPSRESPAGDVFGQDVR